MPKVCNVINGTFPFGDWSGKDILWRTTFYTTVIYGLHYNWEQVTRKGIDAKNIIGLCGDGCSYPIWDANDIYIYNP